MMQLNVAEPPNIGLNNSEAEDWKGLYEASCSENERLRAKLGRIKGETLVLYYHCEIQKRDIP